MKKILLTILLLQLCPLFAEGTSEVAPITPVTAPRPARIEYLGILDLDGVKYGRILFVEQNEYTLFRERDSNEILEALTVATDELTLFDKKLNMRRLVRKLDNVVLNDKEALLKKALTGQTGIQKKGTLKEFLSTYTNTGLPIYLTPAIAKTAIDFSFEKISLEELLKQFCGKSGIRIKIDTDAVYLY
ncbi:MAG: hypothetical protein PHW04_13425 [Candidatus Wallbacteria bacterium]|nr:hypothetical protein [Candidatus Wallbacteria bacterium]